MMGFLGGVRRAGAAAGRWRQLATEVRWRAGYAWNPFRHTGTFDHLIDYPALRRALVDAGITVEPLVIDLRAYRRYMAAAAPEYDRAYRMVYGASLPEKSLEHHLSLQCLCPGPDDVLIDIASATSPFPDIVRRLYGCAVYRQDLAYPAGLDGDRIGGDAAHLPVPDGWATKLTLHCSFEHFEGDADIGFVREAARILRPGGAVCILPLYLSSVPFVVTEPFSDWRAVPCDPRAARWFVRDWPGGRHGRFYDVRAFNERVLAVCEPFRVQVRYVENSEGVSSGCYVRFMLVLEKR
ncbi:MAG: class I SAM-dependent methyltransferase [Chloroflexota bacterium]